MCVRERKSRGVGVLGGGGGDMAWMGLSTFLWPNNNARTKLNESKTVMHMKLSAIWSPCIQIARGKRTTNQSPSNTLCGFI